MHRRRSSRRFAAPTRASRSRSPDSASGPARPVDGGDVRVDDGAVALGDPINARWQLDQLDRRPVEAEHLRHVLARLRIRRRPPGRRPPPPPPAVWRRPAAPPLPFGLPGGGAGGGTPPPLFSRGGGAPPPP